MSLAAFYNSLEYGDITLATNHKSSKVHLVKLSHSKKDDCADNRDPKKRYDKLDLWSARGLCGFSPRYYFEPWPASVIGIKDKCEKCWAAWRGEKQPPVKGWTLSVEDVVTEYPLPYGWREVPAVGHPWDLPKGANISTTKDNTGRIVGVCRTELRRWERGGLIVRIVRVHDNADTVCQVRRHWASSPLSEHSTLDNGSIVECRREAHKCMATGGMGR